jgi:large subunit ribosomal protein L24
LSRISRAIGQKIHVKIGDNVTIISGLYKHKVGTVTKIYHNFGKIIVKGLNLKFKRITQYKDIVLIQIIEAPIHHSNVKFTVI